MAIDVKHAVEKKAFEAALNSVTKKAYNSRGEGYIEVVNMMEKILKDGWKPQAYEKLRTAFSKEGKWTKFFDRILDQTDPEYLKGLFMSIGFEGAFYGYRQTRKSAEKLGIHVPWIILFDPTSACNLHCTGCWAAEYKKTNNLTYEQMDDLVKQANAIGIHEFIMTGGEPLVRKDDIIRLACEHPDNGYMIFTNGTLIDQAFCDGMKKAKNIVLAMSIEGMGEATDQRRGKGVFQKVMDAMDLLRKNGLVYGTSICYTHANYKYVTSDEFLDFLISKGVAYSWYFHYMPVGNDASVDLIPTPEEREYMYHRLREVRGWEGGKPIFTMDFQNDGEFVHGCIAGGKQYCHINSNGDVEPCVFIHYSGANIKEKSLVECLSQPLFKEYQAAQPFNDNLLQPCPMLENPEKLRELVKKTGAKSTDMISPEDVDHLCSKCDKYSKDWAPYAEKLWASTHPNLKKDAEASEAK